MAKKKFELPNDFNPAMQFISTPDNEAESITKANPYARAKKEEAPQDYKINPKYIEKKTKRVQLLMQNSLYEELKQFADGKSESVNNTIHEILKEYLEANK